MENKHKELLILHRAKFVSAIEVEKVLPILLQGDVLNPDDVNEINILKCCLGKISDY